VCVRAVPGGDLAELAALRVKYDKLSELYGSMRNDHVALLRQKQTWQAGSQVTPAHTHTHTHANTHKREGACELPRRQTDRERESMCECVCVSVCECV
jgi:hypothetical protein